jgi:hypothetical protein
MKCLAILFMFLLVIIPASSFNDRVEERHDCFCFGSGSGSNYCEQDYCGCSLNRPGQVLIRYSCACSDNAQTRDCIYQLR